MNKTGDEIELDVFNIITNKPTCKGNKKVTFIVKEHEI